MPENSQLMLAPVALELAVVWALVFVELAESAVRRWRAPRGRR